MSTLVLNLDDRLKRWLDALAAHNHKPLPDWAAFGSIDDPSFRSPERPLPTIVEPLDSGI